MPHGVRLERSEQVSTGRWGQGADRELCEVKSTLSVSVSKTDLLYLNSGCLLLSLKQFHNFNKDWRALW